MNKISTKIFGLYIFFAIFTIIFLSILIFENQIDLFTDNIHYKTKDMAEEISGSLNIILKDEKLYDEGRPLEISEIVTIVKKISDDFYIIAEEGTLMYPENTDIQITSEQKKNVVRAITNKDLLGHTHLYKIYEKDYTIALYFPLTLPHNLKNVVVLLHIDFQRLKEYKDLLRNILIIMILGILIFNVLFAFFVHRMVLAPIKILHDTSIEIGKGKLSERIHLKNKDELGRLATAFNEMTESIQEKVEELEEYNKDMLMELEMAGNVQRGIYPVVSETDMFKLNIYHQPLMKVSGDYHDLLKIGPDKYGILIADVSGHGVPAALITMYIKNLFINNAHNFSDPRDLFVFFNSKLNNLMTQYESFFSAFYVIIEKDRIVYSNAKHMKGYLIRNMENDDPEVVELDTPGYLIGVAEKANEFFESASLSVKKHDKIVILSDGITDAMDKEDNQFTKKRLVEVIETQKSLNGNELLTTILHEKSRFTDGWKPTDDETLIVIEIT